jgi:hypothetical protein
MIDLALQLSQISHVEQSQHRRCLVQLRIYIGGGEA